MITIRRMPLCPAPNAHLPKQDGIEYCGKAGMEQNGATLTVRRMPEGAGPCVKFKRVPFPVAEFDFSPNPAVGPAPFLVRFANESRFADTYLWYFGDGETSTEQSPEHTYQAPGSYTVTLYAYNLAGEDHRTGGVTAVAPGCQYNGAHDLWTPGRGTVERAPVGGALFGSFDVSAHCSCDSLWNAGYNLDIMGIYLRSATSEYRLYWYGGEWWPNQIMASLTGPSAWTLIAEGIPVSDGQDVTPNGSLRMARDSGGNLTAYYHDGSAWVTLATLSGCGGLSEWGVIGGTYTADTDDLNTHFVFQITFNIGCPG